MSQQLIYTRKAKLSRPDTYDAAKNFHRLVYQYGKPLPDSELAEMQDIQLGMFKTISDILGNIFIGDALKVEMVGTTDLSIKAGKVVLKGFQHILAADKMYSQISFQEEYINKLIYDTNSKPLLTDTLDSRIDTVVAVLILREVDSQEDSSIIIPNAGVEFAIRYKVELGIRVLEGVSDNDYDEETNFAWKADEICVRVPIAQIIRDNGAADVVDWRSNSGLILDADNLVSKIEEWLISHTAVVSDENTSVHGIKQGSGNGFNADKVDGKDVNDAVTDRSTLWTAQKISDEIAMASGNIAVIFTSVEGITEPQFFDTEKKYISEVTTADYVKDYMYYHNGTAWVGVEPVKGQEVFVLSHDKKYTFSAAAEWVASDTLLNHNSLLNMNLSDDFSSVEGTEEYRQRAENQEPVHIKNAVLSEIKSLINSSNWDEQRVKNAEQKILEIDYELNGLNRRTELTEAKNLEQEIRLNYLQNRQSTSGTQFIELFNDDSLISDEDYSPNKVITLNKVEENNNWGYIPEEKIYKQGFIKQGEAVGYLEESPTDRFEIASIGQVNKGDISRYDKNYECYWMISHAGAGQIGEITKISRNMGKGKVNVTGRWYLQGITGLHFTGIDVDLNLNCLYIVATYVGVGNGETRVFRLPLNGGEVVGTMRKNSGSTIDMSAECSHSFIFTGDRRATSVTIFDENKIGLIGYDLNGNIELYLVDKDLSQDIGAAPTNRIFLTVSGLAGGFINTSCIMDNSKLYIKYNNFLQVYDLKTKTENGLVYLDSPDFKPNTYLYGDNTGSYAEAIGNSGRSYGSIKHKTLPGSSGGFYTEWYNAEGGIYGCLNGLGITYYGDLLSIESKYSYETSAYEGKYLTIRKAKNYVNKDNIVTGIRNIFNHDGTKYTGADLSGFTIAPDRTYYFVQSGKAANQCYIIVNKPDHTYGRIRVDSTSGVGDWTSILDIDTDGVNVWLLGTNGTKYEVYKGLLSDLNAAVGDIILLSDSVNSKWKLQANHTTNTKVRTGLAVGTTGVFLYNQTDDCIDKLSLDGLTYTASFNTKIKLGSKFDVNDTNCAINSSGIVEHNIDKDTASTDYNSGMKRTNPYYPTGSEFDGKCVRFDGNSYLYLAYSGSSVLFRVNNPLNPEYIDTSMFNAYIPNASLNYPLDFQISEKYFNTKDYFIPELSFENKLGLSVYPNQVVISGIDKFYSGYSCKVRLRCFDALTNLVLPIGPNEILDSTGLTSARIIAAKIHEDTVYVWVTGTEGSFLVAVQLRENKAYWFSDNAAPFANKPGKVYAGNISDSAKGWTGSYNANYRITNLKANIPAANTAYIEARTFTKEQKVGYYGENPLTAVVFGVYHATLGTPTSAILFDWYSDSRILRSVNQNLFYTGAAQSGRPYILADGRVLNFTTLTTDNTSFQISPTPIWDLGVGGNYQSNMLSVTFPAFRSIGGLTDVSWKTPDGTVKTILYAFSAGATTSSLLKYDMQSKLIDSITTNITNTYTSKIKVYDDEVFLFISQTNLITAVHRYKKENFSNGSNGTRFWNLSILLKTTSSSIQTLADYDGVFVMGGMGSTSLSTYSHYILYRNIKEVKSEFRSRFLDIQNPEFYHFKSSEVSEDSRTYIPKGYRSLGTKFYGNWVNLADITEITTLAAAKNYYTLSQLFDSDGSAFEDGVNFHYGYSLKGCQNVFDVDILDTATSGSLQAGKSLRIIALGGNIANYWDCIAKDLSSIKVPRFGQVFIDPQNNRVAFPGPDLWLRFENENELANPIAGSDLDIEWEYYQNSYNQNTLMNYDFKAGKFSQALVINNRSKGYNSKCFFDYKFGNASKSRSTATYNFWAAVKGGTVDYGQGKITNYDSSLSLRLTENLKFVVKSSNTESSAYLYNGDIIVDSATFPVDKLSNYTIHHKFIDNALFVTVVIYDVLGNTHTIDLEEPNIFPEEFEFFKQQLKLYSNATGEGNFSNEGTAFVMIDNLKVWYGYPDLATDITQNFANSEDALHPHYPESSFWRPPNVGVLYKNISESAAAPSATLGGEGFSEQIEQPYNSFTAGWSRIKSVDKLANGNGTILEKDVHYFNNARIDDASGINIYDIKNSGLLGRESGDPSTANRFLRITVNDLNIKDAAYGVTKIIAKDFSNLDSKTTPTPYADEVYVDLNKCEVVLPRQFFMHQMDSFPSEPVIASKGYSFTNSYLSQFNSPMTGKIGNAVRLFSEVSSGTTDSASFNQSRDNQLKINFSTTLPERVSLSVGFWAKLPHGFTGTQPYGNTGIISNKPYMVLTFPNGWYLKMEIINFTPTGRRIGLFNSSNVLVHSITGPVTSWTSYHGSVDSTQDNTVNTLQSSDTLMNNAKGSFMHYFVCYKEDSLKFYVDNVLVFSYSGTMSNTVNINPSIIFGDLQYAQGFVNIIVNPCSGISYSYQSRISSVTVIDKISVWHDYFETVDVDYASGSGRIGCAHPIYGSSNSYTAAEKLDFSYFTPSSIPASFEIPLKDANGFQFSLTKQVEGAKLLVSLFSRTDELYLFKNKPLNLGEGSLNKTLSLSGLDKTKKYLLRVESDSNQSGPNKVIAFVSTIGNLVYEDTKVPTDKAAITLYDTKAEELTTMPIIPDKTVELSKILSFSYVGLNHIFGLSDINRAYRFVALSVDGGDTWYYPDDTRFSWGSDLAVQNRVIDENGYFKVDVSALNPENGVNKIKIKFIPRCDKISVQLKLNANVSINQGIKDINVTPKMYDYALELIK